MPEEISTQPVVSEAEVVGQPTVAAPVAEKKGSGCWKWGLGCLLVGVILLIGVVIVFAVVGQRILNSPEFKEEMLRQRTLQQQDYDTNTYYDDVPPFEPEMPTE